MGRLTDNANKAILSLVHVKYRNRSHAVQYSDYSESLCLAVIYTIKHISEGYSLVVHSYEESSTHYTLYSVLDM